MVVSIIEGVVAIVIAALAGRLYATLVGLRKEMASYVEMGLKAFYQKSKFDPKYSLDELIGECGAPDSILLVARTWEWASPKRTLLDEALRRGVQLSCMVLNARRLEDESLSLRPLQLEDEDAIPNDLWRTLKTILDVCRDAKASRSQGSLDLRMCDFLLFNSLLVTRHEGVTRAVLDFSFGTREEKKYRQLYECDTDDHDHFCNKLYDFYMGLFEQGRECVSYKNGRVTRDPEIIGSAMMREISALLDRYGEEEYLRQNEPARLLRKAGPLFECITGETAAPAPVSVQLEITNKCTAQCHHCRRWEWPQTNEMPVYRAKQIIDELASLGVTSLTLSGGEPTAHSGIVQILEHASGTRLKDGIGILTNGIGVSDDVAEAMVNHAAWVRVSLDGSNASVYRDVRGKDAFGQVQATIRKLNSIARRRHAKCRIGICYCIQTRNVKDVPKAIEFVRSKPGLSNTACPLTLKFAHGGNGFRCSEQEIADFYEEVLQTHRLEWRAVSNLNYLETFIREYSSIQDVAAGEPLRRYYAENRTRCFTPYLFSLIDAFGDVYPCCFLYPDNSPYATYEQAQSLHCMGHISDQTTFGEIWQGSKYIEFRRLMESVDLASRPECARCSRHFLHNAFLTELLGSYMQYGRDEEAVAHFAEVANRLSGAKLGTTWL